MIRLVGNSNNNCTITIAGWVPDFEVQALGSIDNLYGPINNILLQCSALDPLNAFLFFHHREILVEESNVQKVDSPVTVSVCL